MKDIIQQIMNQENLDEIYGYAQNALFKDGPVSITTLEILSYLKLFAPDYFSAVEEEILSIMGIFYKKPTARTLQSKLFELYSEHIRQTYHHDYTPVQANILKQIQANQHFSFSAPTSTGKSHVFRHLIETSKRDVAIIVPSRALINEYYDRICELISDKSVNILSDIFYAIFSEYYKRTNDIRALKMAQYFKYGTDNENEIWMLRYGLSFEDIEILKPYIVSIGQEEIVFSADIQNLSPEQIKPVKRYL